jgi:carboxyl-terminal processing protease
MKRIIAVFIFLVSFFATGLVKAQDQDFIKESYKYGRFLECLERFYFDSVDVDKIVEKAIVDELKDLDPHSIYISSEDVRKMNEPLQGNFEGVGISFNILNDTLFVVETIAGGPSEKVGVKAGDRILKVDSNNIAGVKLTNDKVFSLLRGPKGTEVYITVLRRNVKELLDFKIVRDKIPINSIDASYIAGDGIGYIKLTRFSMTTMDEFFKSANELKNKGARNLILDLTGNGGGYLEVAANLADQFLSADKLIVYTQGLHSIRRDYVATSKGIFENGKVVLLIDEGSASASEIVSGAIQDWDRGIIIGRRSFGKGLVQNQIPLPDGSMIRLTIARYYTPSGRLIQKPYNDGNDKYEKEIYDRYKHGEFENQDSIKLPDSLKFKTLVKGRIVFGGGGIMPDIFVPLDTSFYSDYYRDIIRKGILNQFVLQYVDKNRNNIMSSYDNFSKFKTGFVITPGIISELTAYAEKEGVKYKGKDLTISTEGISMVLKAYIARDIWTANEFYEIMNQKDANYLKALDVMNNWDKYSKIVFR